MDGQNSLTNILHEQFEKRQLKNECNLMGLVTAGPQLLLTAIVTAITMLALFLNKTEAIISILGGLEAQIVLSVLIFVVPFLITTRIRYRSFNGIFPIRPVRAGLMLPLLFASLSAMLLLNLLMEPYMQVLETLGLSMDYDSFDIPDGISGGVLYVFTIAVVPALVEEFAFRGVVLNHLRRYGNTFAILASSLLFGLMHGNLVQMPFAFAAGCIMAYIDIITGSMLPSIILHFLNNAVSAVGSLVEFYMGEASGMWFMTVVFSICFVAGIVSVWLLAKRYPYAFRSAGRGALSTGEAFRAFVGTAGFWVPVVFFGGEALVLAVGL